MALFKAAEDDPDWLYAYGLFTRLRHEIAMHVGSAYWKRTKYYRDTETMEAILRDIGSWVPQIVPQDNPAEEYEEIMAAQEMLCQLIET